MPRESRATRKYRRDNDGGGGGHRRRNEPSLEMEMEMMARVAADVADEMVFAAFRAEFEVQYDGGNCVRVRRRDGKPVLLPWDELQNLIHEAVGPHACAVEVFPPLDDVVDEANVRHFWLVHPDTLIRAGAWLHTVSVAAAIVRGRRLAEEG